MFCCHCDRLGRCEKGSILLDPYELVGMFSFMVNNFQLISLLGQFDAHPFQIGVPNTCGGPRNNCMVQRARISGVHPSAVKQSFTPSLLSTCPTEFHLLLRTSQLISLIPANSTTLLFVILCNHLILSFRLGHCHWKLFSFLLSVCVIFHVSQLYSSTPLAAHTFHSL